MRKNISTKILSLFFLSVSFSAFSNSLQIDSIIFKHTSFDFGEVKQGAEVRHLFSFENNTDFMVVIKDVVVQCGCTASNYSKEIIGSGDNSNLEISFNSEGKYGQIRKNIRVVFSNGQETKLTILAYIVD